jgi:two-component system cell cycle response regulator
MESVILIIDDNAEIIEFLSDNLAPKYAVRSAYNGPAALQILENETVHLIVSDIMMPAMDGFEICSRVKSSIDYCHIPVILLTAKKTLDSRIEGLEKGADAYIEKPFSPRHLQAQIDNLLTNRNKLKEFFANSPLTHFKSMAYSKADEEFLEKLNNIIVANLKSPDLDVDFLAKEMYISRATLYRKINDICNLSPNELIKVSRLKKAAQLLAESKLKVYEISDMVGFASQHHFARCFLKQFNMTASEFQAMNYSA